MVFRVRKRLILGSFPANLIECPVSKCSFSVWDTVSQLSRLQLMCTVLLIRVSYRGSKDLE